MGPPRESRVASCTTLNPAHSAALRLLARRELSTAQLRDRLRQRGHADAEIEAATSQLRQSGALDDGRVARAHARTAAAVKGRGRVRVARELEALGIARDTVKEAVEEVFRDVDERAQIVKALARKTRGRPVSSAREKARLHQFLLRKGFTPSAIIAALRDLGGEDQT